MIFLNSASSAAPLVFYLPGVCAHTDTEGKQRKARVRNIFKHPEKNTIFYKHPVVSLFTAENHVFFIIIAQSSVLLLKRGGGLMAARREVSCEGVITRDN